MKPRTKIENKFICEEFGLTSFNKIKYQKIWTTSKKGSKQKK
jgi:hypothetical protein